MNRKFYLPLILTFAFLPCRLFASQSANFMVDEYVVALSGGDVASSTSQVSVNLGECFIGAALSSEHLMISGFFEALALPGGAAVPYLVDLPADKAVMLLKNKIDPTKGEIMMAKFRVTDSSSRVSIRLYTLAGELVKTLVDETLPAGEYTRPWTGKNQNDATVANGIYLVQVKIGSKTEVLKAAVLKK